MPLEELTEAAMDVLSRPSRICKPGHLGMPLPHVFTKNPREFPADARIISAPGKFEER